MKKTQIALAAMALVASTAAMANGVTVYGTVDISIVNSTSGTGMGGLGNNQGSIFGFKGSEDLGNGMKASFQLETGVSLNNGAATSGGVGGASAQASGFGALMTRVATVGLSGDFGSLTAGLQLSPYIIPNVVGAGAGMGPGSFFVNRMLLSGFGTAAVNMAGSTSYAYDGFFIPNSINYTSPSLNGWTVNAMTTTKAGAKDGVVSTAADTESYQAYTLGGAVGSIGIMAGYQTRKNVNSSYTLAATLPLSSDLTLAASYMSYDETKGYGSGYKIGSSSVFFNYRLSDALSTQLGYARNDLANEMSLTSVSMKYDLSKRTFTYASYGRGTGGADASFANRGGFTFNAGGASTTNFAVGVGHSF